MYIYPASVASNCYSESMFKQQAVFQITFTSVLYLHPILKATSTPETEMTLKGQKLIEYININTTAL